MSTSKKELRKKELAELMKKAENKSTPVQSKIAPVDKKKSNKKSNPAKTTKKLKEAVEYRTITVPKSSRRDLKIRSAERNMNMPDYLNTLVEQDKAKTDYKTKLADDLGDTCVILIPVELRDAIKVESTKYDIKMYEYVSHLLEKYNDEVE